MLLDEGATSLLPFEMSRLIIGRWHAHQVGRIGEGDLDGRVRHRCSARGAVGKYEWEERSRCSR